MKVQYLTTTYRILPGYIFAEDVTADEIAGLLENDRQGLVNYFGLDISEEDEFYVSAITNREIFIGNDEEGVTVEIDYTTVIKK